MDINDDTFLKPISQRDTYYSIETCTWANCIKFYEAFILEKTRNIFVYGATKNAGIVYILHRPMHRILDINDEWVTL